MMPPAVRGWCPGARRPMASLDGLLMRLRIAGGALPADAAFLLADTIEAAGGEGIELSQRGNMQICGLSQAGWRQILSVLTPLGVIDDDEPAEAMRNILCSPLAGLDRLAVRDIRCDVAGLARALTALSARYRLPAKFSWIVEDGGALSLADIDADLRFLAVPDGWALGVGRRDGVVWFAGSDAPAAMAYRWVPVLARQWPGQRLRDLSAGDLAALTVSLHPIPAPLRPARGVTPGRQIAGGIELLSVGLPFGRLPHAGLRLLAGLARDRGVGELRLTPWRQIILPAVSRASDDIDWRGADLLIDGDPLLSYFACRGGGYCPQALAPVRPLARQLAALDMLPGRRLHVSGCAKGCAHPAAADVTLVACAGGFGLVRRGRARDSPCRTVTVETLLERSFWKAMVRDD